MLHDHADLFLNETHIEHSWKNQVGSPTSRNVSAHESHSFRSKNNGVNDRYKWKWIAPTSTEKCRHSVECVVWALVWRHPYDDLTRNTSCLGHVDGCHAQVGNLNKILTFYQMTSVTCRSPARVSCLLKLARSMTECLSAWGSEKGLFVQKTIL